MTDDWNLDKAFDGVIQDIPLEIIDIVETLRQNLIEDFMERFKHECGVCGQMVISDEEIKEIINKRFGHQVYGKFGVSLNPNFCSICGGDKNEEGDER